MGAAGATDLELTNKSRATVRHSHTTHTHTHTYFLSPQVSGLRSKSALSNMLDPIGEEKEGPSNHSHLQRTSSIGSGSDRKTTSSNGQGAVSSVPTPK